MRFTRYGEPSDREIDAQRLPPYCPQCEEPAENYDELCPLCALEAETHQKDELETYEQDT